MTITVLNLNGTISMIDISNKDMLLATMQSIVGGYIEVASVINDKAVIVNEEGRIYGLPVNEKANEILRVSGNKSMDPILGTAILVDIKDLE